MAETSQRALILVHEPNGGPAVLGRALVERGWTLDHHLVTNGISEPHDPNPFPVLLDHNLVVIMGSVHSVYDRSRVGAWIDDELDLIRAAHEADTPVLGVCFGAQAAAAALGGSVESSPVTEIGWYDIEGPDLPVDRGPWLQWHHDRFSVPSGADVLATTPETIQFFRLRSTVGVQFHPEVDVDHIRTWLDMAPDDYLADHGVERSSFLTEAERWAEISATNCRQLLDWFLSTVVDGGE